MRDPAPVAGSETSRVSPARKPAAISATALDRACAEVQCRWQRYLPEAEAAAEASAFRRRFEALAAQGRLTDAEYGAALAAIAEAMA